MPLGMEPVEYVELLAHFEKVVSTWLLIGFILALTDRIARLFGGEGIELTIVDASDGLPPADEYLREGIFSAIIGSLAGVYAAVGGVVLAVVLWGLQYAVTGHALAFDQFGYTVIILSPFAGLAVYYDMYESAVRSGALRGW